jgi:hypothetical protein
MHPLTEEEIREIEKFKKYLSDNNLVLPPGYFFSFLLFYF